MINELAKHGNTELLSILVAALNEDGYYVNQAGGKVYAGITDNIGRVEVYDRDEQDYEVVKEVYDKSIVFFTVCENGDYLGMIFVDDEYIVGGLKDHPWFLPDLDSLGDYDEEKIRYRAKFEDGECDVLDVFVYDRREDKNYEVGVSNYYDVFHAMICAIENVVSRIDIDKKFPADIIVEV